MPKNTDMLIDLQYGSTGKGLVAGYLSYKSTKEIPYDTVVSANMPNAGHTAYDWDGSKFIHKVLPSGIFHGPRSILVGPGAVFSIAQLEKEIIQLLDHGHLSLGKQRIYVHAQATVLTGKMKRMEEESPVTKIASTAQGSMVAQMIKMARDPDDNPTAKMAQGDLRQLEVKVLPHRDWSTLVTNSRRILAEGAQGYSLGINQDFYPYCTSRDCGPARFLSDMAIPWIKLNKVIGVLRTYPIRVGSTDKGSSGSCYEDQTEIGWKDIGVPPEITTVTGRERRVFSFSRMQLREALVETGASDLFINFFNYLHPSARSEFMQMVKNEADDFGATIKFIGKGRTPQEVEEVVEL
jgi:adenylosuccinate synthase